MINNYVLCIQPFVKVDTFTYALNCISKAKNIKNYTLVIGIDSVEGAKKVKPFWHEKNNEIKIIAENFKNKNICKNTFIIRHKTNVGPYQGCKKIIDFGMTLGDYTIFLEDDSIISEDFLLFHQSVFNNFVCKNNNIFSVCGGSINSKTAYCNNKNYLYKAVRWPWVGSSEFGITKNIWNKYGHVRGEICGDRKFGLICKEQKMVSIIPKIKRMCRMGINHPDAFTMRNTKNENCIINKNCIPDSNLFDINYSNYNITLI